MQQRRRSLLHFYFYPAADGEVAESPGPRETGRACLRAYPTDKQAPTNGGCGRRGEPVTGKSKRVKLQIEDPVTGKVRTLEFILPTRNSDCPRTDLFKQKVIILRRKLRWKRLAKGASESRMSTAQAEGQWQERARMRDRF